MARAGSDLEHHSQPENSAGSTQHLHGLAVPPSRCPLLALPVSLGEVAFPAPRAVGKHPAAAQGLDLLSAALCISSCLSTPWGLAAAAGQWQQLGWRELVALPAKRG